MASKLVKLTKDRAVSPPSWLPNAVQYETLMGSHAYGINTENSDFDIYGWCMPPKEMLFPHQIGGEIEGFDSQKKRFSQYQQHHIKAFNKEYDVTIYSIVRYFALLSDCNPNICDSVFVPNDSVLHITKIGEMVRERRDMFLHKGAHFKFKGYAFSKRNKAFTKNPDPNSARYNLVLKHGYDTKFLSHCVRLLLECEQILETGTIDLRKDREHVKAVRNGLVAPEDVNKWFDEKESSLNKLYETSKLQHGPPRQKIKQLLIDCIEEQYGSISNLISMKSSKADQAVEEIKQVIEKYRV